MKRHSWKQLLGGGAVVIFLVTLFALLTLDHSALTPITLAIHSAPGPTPDETLFPGVSRWFNDVSPEIQAQILQAGALRAEALRNPPTPSNFNKPIPTALPNKNVGKILIPQTPAGAGTIIDTGQGLPPAFAVMNQWRTTTNTEHIIVYAGGLRDSEIDTTPHQGFVMVVFRSLDWTHDTHPSIFLKTPGATGPVRITDANGMQLKLVARNGTQFTFDVAKQKFISP